MNTPTFLSLFSGIGGLDLGLHRAGWACQGQVELKAFGRKVLARHWPDVPKWADVRQFNEPLTVDLICAGSPCQDFSVAGGRRGLDGEQSGLFHEFMRVAQLVSPNWLLFENVRGILSANGGGDFGAIVRAVEDLGYGWAYRVLNSRYFGVAQSRRRLYLVGHRGNPVPPAVLFEPSASGALPMACGEATQETAHMAPGSHDTNQTRDYFPADTSASLEACTPGARAHNDLSDNFRLFHGMLVQMPPTEAERLQGFPDGWTCLCGSWPYDSATCRCPDGPRYEAIGNAVSVPVAAWIGRNILRYV